jgi:hypothetical protein
MEAYDNYLNNLPEHKPDEGLWSGIDKELSKMEANDAFRQSLKTLPLHQPSGALWNNIESQLGNNAAATSWPKALTGAIISLLSLLILFYSISIENQKNNTNSNPIIVKNAENHQKDSSTHQQTTSQNRTNPISHSSEKKKIKHSPISDKIGNTATPSVITINMPPQRRKSTQQTTANSTKIDFPFHSNSAGRAWHFTSLNTLLTTFRLERENRHIIFETPKDYKLQNEQSGKLTKANSQAWFTKQLFGGMHYAQEIRHNVFNNQRDALRLGLDIGFKKESFFFQGGVDFQFTKDQGTYEIDYLQNEIVGGYTQVDSIRYSVDPDNSSIIKHYITSEVNLYDSLEHTVEKQVDNRYTYLKVPLTIGYQRPVVSKLSVYGKAGAEFSVLIQGDEPVPTIQEEEIRIVQQVRKSPLLLHSDIKLLFGLGIKIPIFKRLSINIEAQHRTSIDKYYERTKKEMIRPSSTNIQCGILYNF